MKFISDLDANLLKLGPNGFFTLRDACAGLHATGRIGGGKTSAVSILARAFLRAGMGGIVTAAKPGEVTQWKKYCAEEGRTKSLLLFDENEGFNFLSYLLARHGIAGIGTVTDCLMRVLETVKKASGTMSKKGEEPFFEESKRLLLRFSILPLYAAKGSLSIADIIRFVESAPKTAKDATDPEWKKRSFMYEVILAAAQSPKVALPPNVLKENIDYWTQAYTDIPEKTRGNMVVTVTAALDRFRHGVLEKMFCGRTTIVPEMTFHGAVLVLATPSVTYNEDGVIAQQLFKTIWQRTVLSRNSLAQKHRERPLFSWCDEAQVTVNSEDEGFLGLARESKCCPVYMTQSLPTYYSKIGGDTPREDALTLMGKFGTHLFLTNSCAESNEYAARVIGKIVTRRNSFNAGTSRSVNVGMSAGSSQSDSSASNYGNSYSHQTGQGGSNNSRTTGSGNTHGTSDNFGENRGQGRNDSESRGYSEAMEYVFEPGDFGRLLKTGGPANDHIVTGVWYQSGRKFDSAGTNTFLARFKQQ
jgi:hypothetical protein